MAGQGANHDGNADAAGRDGGAESRQALLEAGVRLLAQASRDELNGLVSAKAVADEASLSRQTFYRRWDQHSDYVDDLIAYITDPGRSPGTERLADLGGESEGVDPDDPAAEVRRLSSQTFGRFNGDPTQISRMLFWAVHLNDEVVADRLRNLFATNDQVAAAGFGLIGEALGIEPRPPFTLETVALLFNALRDGLVLRLGIDPDRVPDSFHGDVMVAVTTAVVRRIGDPDDELTVDEVLRRAVAGPDGTDGPAA